LVEIHPIASSTNYPSMAMRRGDFSALCDAYTAGACSETNPNLPNVQLYNPTNGQPFLNNQIAADMITSQSKLLTSFLPTPTNMSSPGLPNEDPN